MSAYLERMRESIAKFEEAAATFERRTAYCQRFGPDADFRADRDKERNKAKQDCAFHSTRAQMYALAALAEQGRTVPMTRLTAPATPTDRRASYDPMPTLIGDPAAAYARYAARLDRTNPGWHRDDLDQMAPGLAALARDRRLAERSRGVR